MSANKVPFENRPIECRFCGITGNATIDLFKHGLAQKAEKCFYLSIEPDDRLPKRICRKCQYALCAAYSFGEKARLVDKKLRQKYGSDEEDYLNIEYLQEDTPFQYLTYETDPVGLALEKLKGTSIAIKKAVPTPVSTANPMVTCGDVSQNEVVEEPEAEVLPKKYKRFDADTVINLSGHVPCICLCCSKRFSCMDQLIEHKSECNEDSYICRKCGKVLDSVESLKKHQQTHYDYRRTYTCPSCDEVFKNSFLFDNHRAKMHGEEIEERGYVYRCCNKEFLTRRELHEHAKIHEVPPSVCAVCSKSFKSKHSLRMHLKVHEDYKPYVCKECGMAFKKKVFLFQHQAQDHNGVELIRCDQCPKKFGKKESLKIHCQRYHTSETSGMAVHSRKRVAQDHSYEGEIGREEEV
ncbi:zinc finger protein 700-like [Armigeres subalbatus]|uniref:zinc finger protein 700-like n=1 Tax=Armigeres subalbatus TaxID=124917 RepID=UPI002ED3410D